MIIRDRQIWPPLLLAPMAGLTHSALRTTVLDFGGVGLLATEMLSASRLPAENPRLSPYLVHTPVEHPLACQVLLTGEEYVPQAFAALHRYQADCIDLNLGCPAPKVRRAGGGSSLAEDLDKVRRIVRCARQHTHLPLTGKIRLGETLDAATLRDFCLMLVDEGVDLLTVHARLRGESFARPPHWDWLAKVKGWIPIPVVANGSIDSVESAKACLAASGVDGLMIGRAAAVRPWIFALLARQIYQVDIPEPVICLPVLYQRFVRALLERFLPERRLGRLKEFTHYFARNYFFGHHLAARVQACQSLEEAWVHAAAFFAGNDPEASAVLCSPFNGINEARADCSRRGEEKGREL